MFKVKIKSWINFVGLLLIPYVALAAEHSAQAAFNKAPILKSFVFSFACFFISWFAGAFVFQYFFKLKYKVALLQMLKMKAWSLLYYFVTIIPLMFGVFVLSAIAAFFEDAQLLNFSDTVVIILYALSTALLTWVSYYIYWYAYSYHVDSSVNQLTLRKALLVIISLDFVVMILQNSHKVTAFINSSIV